MAAWNSCLTRAKHWTADVSSSSVISLRRAQNAAPWYLILKFEANPPSTSYLWALPSNGRPTCSLVRFHYFGSKTVWRVSFSFAFHSALAVLVVRSLLLTLPNRNGGASSTWTPCKTIKERGERDKRLSFIRMNQGFNPSLDWYIQVCSRSYSPFPLPLVRWAHAIGQQQGRSLKLHKSAFAVVATPFGTCERRETA